MYIKKICIDIKMEQTEGSLPKHNVEKNATNLYNKWTKAITFSTLCACFFYNGAFFTLLFYQIRPVDDDTHHAEFHISLYTFILVAA